MPTATAPQWETLRATCLECHQCPLADTRQHVVFADGNPEAEIMIIGEGPGRHEDETGIPFVGRAGQLLTKILESVQLDRAHDVYIANIVKCRPPQNRVPTSEEMERCIPYLHQQIALVKPKIILLAGATAVKGLLGKQAPISRIRGTWMEWEGIQVMPVFHPSYLLRNDSKTPGSPKWLMWQDIQAVRNKYDELRGNACPS